MSVFVFKDYCQAYANKIKRVYQNNKLIKVAAICATILVVRKLYKNIIRKYNQYPPGFDGVPLYGSLFSWILFPRYFLYCLGVLGPIAMTQIGAIRTVFINDPQLVKTLFTDKRFHHRPPVMSSKAVSFAWLSNDIWKKRRKFAMKTVLTLTNSDFILHKVSETINHGIRNHLETNIIPNQARWYPSDATYLFSFNNVFSAVFGINLNWKDPFIDQFHEYNEKFLKNAMTNILLNHLFPKPFNLPSIIKNRLLDTEHYRELSHELILDFMNRHGFKVDANNNVIQRIKDEQECNETELIYIDLVIKEHQNNNMSVDDIIADIQLLLAGGVDTTQQSAEFAFLVLAKYPQIQQKVYNELIHVFPGKKFTFKKLNQLHYFRAFIYEALRMFAASETSIPHFIKEQIHVEFEGKEWNIPAPSICYINNYFIHKHSHQWDGTCYEWPRVNDTFHWEYWIDRKDGKFRMNQHFNQFGKGRDCPGQALAIRALFAIFGVMILEYSYSWPRNQSKVIRTVHGTVTRVEPRIGIYVHKR
eukprot:56750_1